MTRSATIASWMNMAIQMAGMLVIIPLLYSRWSELEIGVYLLISSICRFSLLFSDRLTISFATLFSFAATGVRSLQPRMKAALAVSDAVEHRGEQDSNLMSPEEKQEQFSNIYKTLTTLLLGIAAITAAFTTSLGYLSLLKLSDSFGGPNFTCQAAFTLSIIGLVIRIFFIRYEVYLRGIDRVADVQNWNAAFNLACLTLIIIAILLNGTLLHWAIIFNVFILLTGLRNRKLALLADDHFKIRNSHWIGWHRPVAAAAWKPTWTGLVSAVSYVGSDEIVAIASPFYLQGEAATQYLLYNRCLSVVGPISQIPLTSRMPYMAQLISRGSVDQLKDFFVKRLLLCTLISVIGANLVGLFIPILNYIMEKPGPMIPPTEWAIVATLFLLVRVAGHLTIVLESGNLILYTGLRVAATAITFLILAFSLQYWGIAGGFIALLAPRVVVLGIAPLLAAARYLSTSAKTIFVPSYLVVLIFQVLAFFASILVFDAWYQNLLIH